jgi:cell shape-determining protein MreC
VEAVGGAVEFGSQTVSREDHDRLARENAALRHQAAALALRVTELEGEVELLTATRLFDAGGGRLGARGRLIPAAIVAPDLLSWRASRLVNAGSLQGVRRDAPVVSRYFTLDEGAEGGIRDGMSVVLGEALIGVVDQVGTHDARFKLLSDVTVQMKVRIGRFTDNGFVPLTRYFWLTGRGAGKMEIHDAEKRDVDSGLVREGDVVLSDLTSGTLPVALTVGRITEVRPDRDNPLLSILTIESEVDPVSLRRVYIYDPTSGKGEP